MVIVCPKCQALCSPKMSFCQSCGASLEKAASTAATTTNPETEKTELARASPSPLQLSQPVAANPALPSKDAPSLAPVAPNADSKKETTLDSSDVESLQNVAGVPKGTASIVSSAVNAALQGASGTFGPDFPLAVSVNFNRVLVAGYSSTLEIRIESTSPAPIEDIEVTLDSRGFKSAVVFRTARLAPGLARKGLLEVEPQKPGSFILNCAVKLISGRQQLGFLGSRALNINAVPESANISINLSDFKFNSGSGSNQGLGSEIGEVHIRDLVGSNVVRSLNDLLGLEFRENYQPMELQGDYELSLSAIDIQKTQAGLKLTIPKSLIGCVHSGKRVKLLPVDPKSARPVCLITGSEFKLGRSQQDADFVTWFWPRNADNDERTRHLSKIHVICSCAGTGRTIRDAGSANGSSFDGQTLRAIVGEPLDRRGLLRIGADYLLDVMPTPPAYETSPPIANLRQWAGPPESPAKLRGAVRFLPASEVLPQDTIWLGTDATFGSARTNPLVLDLPGLAEIQGKFLHHRSCLWLENNSEEGVVQVNQTTLKPGEVAPLVSGQQIKLGQIPFRVEISG